MLGFCASLCCILLVFMFCVLYCLIVLSGLGSSLSRTSFYHLAATAYRPHHTLQLAIFSACKPGTARRYIVKTRCRLPERFASAWPELIIACDVRRHGEWLHWCSWLPLQLACAAYRLSARAFNAFRLQTDRETDVTTGLHYTRQMQKNVHKIGLGARAAFLMSL